MAYRDYILCKTCHCKIVYDGSGNGRNRLETYWGNPEADEWTVGLLCPDCIAAERDALCAEVERLRAALEQVARLGNGDRYEISVGDQIAIAALQEPTP